MSAQETFNELNKRLFNPQKEKDVLGHLVNIPGDQTEILLELKPDHFNDQNNRELYELMTGMFQGRRSINRISVSDYIDLKGKSSSQKQTLHALLDTLSSTKLDDTVFNSIALLKDLNKNRKIYYEVLVKGQTMFMQNEPSDKIMNHMANILAGVEGAKREKPIDQVTDNVVNQIMNPHIAEKGKLTGLHDLDIGFGGIKKDRYYTIGAAPGVGKTAMAIDIMHRLCNSEAKKDIKILFFSLEMSEDRIVRRFISRLTGFTNDKLEERLKPLSKEDKAKVEQAGKIIREYPMEIVYATTTCQSLELRTKKFAIENPGKHLIVFLDHIGLVKGDTSDMRVNTIRASQTMKSFCRDYTATSFVLTQLKKELVGPQYKKIYHKPDKSFIMESGQIDQDSDGIWLLWRPEAQFATIPYNSVDEWPTDKKLIALNEKNRDGQSFTDMIFGCDIGTNHLWNSGDAF